MSTFPNLLSYTVALRQYVQRLAHENLMSDAWAMAASDRAVLAYRDRDVDALRDLADETRFFDLDESCETFFD